MTRWSGAVHAVAGFAADVGRRLVTGPFVWILVVGTCAGLIRDRLGLSVPLGAALVLAVPAYVALFWLIYERQAGKDAVDDATRRSIAAYRKSVKTEEQAVALRRAVQALTDHLTGANTPKGRHHR